MSAASAAVGRASRSDAFRPVSTREARAGQLVGTRADAGWSETAIAPRFMLTSRVCGSYRLALREFLPATGLPNSSSPLVFLPHQYPAGRLRGARAAPCRNR